MPDRLAQAIQTADVEKPAVRVVAPLLHRGAQISAPADEGALTRRGVLASGAALAATPALARESVSLKQGRVPVGTCVQALHLDDPELVRLLLAQVSQLTAEWQMNMEYIIRPDGGFQFEAPDRIAAFAQANGLRLFGHTLVWYDQAHPAFQALDESRISFGDAYRNYILAVTGRYRGRMSGWNVVNEAVSEDGTGLRSSLWSQRLGEIEHMAMAFRAAREGDPGAALFLNEYNLEYLPTKRATFLRTAERLLAAGAPVTGLGAQMHLAADIAPTKIYEMMSDLAGLGLPIHVSELDVSLVRADDKRLGQAELKQRQALVYAAVAEAFARLPSRQQFAFTFWGLRDKDSWLVAENAADTPAPFDNLGRAKPGTIRLGQSLQG